MNNSLLKLLVIFTIVAVVFQGQLRPVAGQISVELRGTFLIVWGDGAEQKDGTAVGYFLAEDSGQTYELKFSPLAELNLMALYRQPVVVLGTWIRMPDEEMGIVKVDLIFKDETRQSEPEGVFGHQPWVSILCKFLDYSDEPKDLVYFQGMYSDTYPGLDHYWREQSFDLVDLIGSGAFGWYVLPYPRSHYVPPSGYMDWGAAAQDCTAAADAYVDFSPFVGINLMFNADLDGYAWGGSWYLCLDGVCQQWRMTWEPPWGYGNIGVIAHETGHGFGLPHSSGDYGQTYDNAWDVMSDVWSNGDRGGVDPVYGTMGQHTISYHKNILEWIDSDQMVVVPTGTRRTVVVEQIALPQTDEAMGIKIQINDSQNYFYTVETRRFAGYDSWLPGEAVIIHHVDVNRADGNPAHVVDIDHNGNTGDAGAMWLPGESFVDTTSGIVVIVGAATETGFVVTVENQFLHLQDVEVSGPTEGFIGEFYSFTAEVLPIEATEPITYVWEATGQLPITHTGGIEDQVSFSWQDIGTKSITVTVTNPGSVVTDTTVIELQNQANAPDSAEIEGPVEPLAGVESRYTASVGPITTTLPITYVWQASGQEPVTQTDGLTDTVTIIWGEPGEQQISLVAMNPAGEVTATFSTLVITPELATEISGTTTGHTGKEYVFTAQTSPITATLPLTYVWTIGELPPITHTGGLTDALTIVLELPGTYTITLQVSNAYASTITTWEIAIMERLFIPVITK
jgi:M6 family metalloprotease-like protein